MSCHVTLWGWSPSLGKPCMQACSNWANVSCMGAHFVPNPKVVGPLGPLSSPPAFGCIAGVSVGTMSQTFELTLLVFLGVAFVALPQVVTNLATPLGISKTRLKAGLKLLKSKKRANIKPVSKRLTAKLKQHGVIHARAPICNIISMKTLVNLMRLLGCSSGLLATLEQPQPSMQPAAKKQQQVPKPLPKPKQAKLQQHHLQQPHFQGPVQQQHHHQHPVVEHHAAGVTSSFPTTLPECTIPCNSHNKRRKYGLSAIKPAYKKEALVKAITPALNSIRDWSMSTIQLDRPLPTSLRTITWEKEAKNIMSYLGFLYNFHNIEHPTPAAYLNARLFAAYLAYLMQVTWVLSGV